MPRARSTTQFDDWQTAAPMEQGSGCLSLLSLPILGVFLITCLLSAFAVFYTGGSVAGAGGPFLFGLLGDAVGLAPTMAVVAFVALASIPMVVALRSAFRGS